VFEDNSMKPLERRTHGASFRTGIIVLGAMMCLALSPMSARRLAPAMLAAIALGGAAATPAAAETNDTAIRPFRVDVPAAALADLRKRLDKGGHFAAWEEPELFAGELRSAFRSLRSAN
jgi:hypothetical protein